ncbi:MAG TPA: hypothetical protein VJO34_07035 [Methylomirabilota bacterium]|nr:hypothetical protein [Methylomirabilota bacterium]
MPYESGHRLPGERASKLGHLDVIKSPLVKKLCESFEDDTGGSQTLPVVPWEPIPDGGRPLRLVFSVDGSLQVIESEVPPHKALAFVKTALLKVDRVALDSIDRLMPHPYALRDLMSNSAMYHATVFPMRHVTVPGLSVYDSVRQTLFESVNDPRLEGEPMETLKWLAYEKWDGRQKSLPPFQCPHCASDDATLAYDAESGACPKCGERLFLTDMLGFHLEMAEESAPDSVASAYMMIHETLLLFTGVRYFWEHKRELLPECLFIRDGPLSIRAQYSKLVAPIRRFLQVARESGSEVCMIGQEKTGYFVDHLTLIGPSAPEGTVFLPGHTYVREQIQHRPAAGMPYGKDTNYGVKVFVKVNDRHSMVLSIPTGEYKSDPTKGDLIGATRIFSTLPSLLSSQYEGGLFPIELAHNIASLSTYPSAKVLALFAEAM